MIWYPPYAQTVHIQFMGVRVSKKKQPIMLHKWEDKVSVE